MSHPCFGFGSEEVARRRLEERKDRRVLERRRVRYIDDHGGASQSARQALPRDRVDARIGGRCQCVVAMLTKPRDKLGADESGAADDDDLHGEFSLGEKAGDQIARALRDWKSVSRNALTLEHGTRSTMPEKLTLDFKVCAARMSVHPASARAPPTLMRRTPSAAMSSTPSPMSRTTRRLNGFGRTASTSVSIASGVCGPGAKSTSAPAAP